jgi:hypothetical protein
VGGGVYNLGTFLFDATTIIAHNHAATSHDDFCGGWNLRLKGFLQRQPVRVRRSAHPHRPRPGARSARRS